MNYPACPVHHLPNFESIQPDTIEQEVAGKIKTAISAINAAAIAKQMTAETLVFDLEEALEDLDQYWSAVSHLHAVANNEALREGYQKGQAKLTDFYSDLGQNKGLFNQYQNVSQQSAYQNTNKQVQSAVAHSLKGFKLSGVDLEGKDAIDFKEIQKRLSELTTQFSNNVLDSTMNWGYQTQDIEELAGCPEFVIQAAKAKAQEKQVDGYWLTLDLPIYMTVMTQAGFP